MASQKALEQRSIAIPDPRIVNNGPWGKVRRLDWSTLDDEGYPDEKVTFENLNRANWRRLLKDSNVIVIEPRRLHKHVDPKSRTLDRRPDWLLEIEEG